MNEAEEMVEVEEEVPSQCYSEGSGKIQESQALSPQSPQQPRRVSCEEAPVKNFELRRCRSEVARPRSSTCAECAAAAASSPVNGAAALLLGVPEQNALTAIDKIQAIHYFFFFYLKKKIRSYHYFGIHYHHYSNDSSVKGLRQYF